MKENDEIIYIQRMNKGKVNDGNLLIIKLHVIINVNIR